MDDILLKLKYFCSTAPPPSLIFQVDIMLKCVKALYVIGLPLYDLLHCSVRRDFKNIKNKIKQEVELIRILEGESTMALFCLFFCFSRPLTKSVNKSIR